MRSRLDKPFRSFLLLAPALAIAFLASATSGWSQQPDNLRILSYNTAFMYVEAELTGPPTGPPCATSCKPFEFPPFPNPCTCSSLTVQVNLGLFADVDEVTRARKIAVRIRETDQDVVVLNEVFDPSAREVLEQELAALGPYKHYVAVLRGKANLELTSLGDLVGGGPDFLSELPAFLGPYQALNLNSGLMLFSKYPFLELQGNWVPNDAVCGEPYCELVGLNNGMPIAPNEVAFKVFGACGNLDCLASKGVAMVKIATPRGPSYVAFTHLQADYADTFWTARRAQYEEIQRVMDGVIPAVERADAFVYLAGDLNSSGYTRDSSQTSSNQEWHSLFNPASSAPNVAGGYFACGNGLVGSPSRACRYGLNGSRHLVDGWGFETSTTDRANDGSRLDYILHSSVVGRLCAQHLELAWDLQADAEDDGGLMWLSDHFPVRGDFGLSSRWCSANDDATAAGPHRNARLLEFGPTNCTQGGSPPCQQDLAIGPPQARINMAGNFQWYMIDQAGSYSMKIDSVAGQKVAFDVYHHTDLSRPVMPFDEQPTRWGTLYSFPKPPYYIRTYAVDASGKTDRVAKGRDYTLKVHQHLCRSAVDACALTPGLALAAPEQYVWPTTVFNDPLTEVRELWWRFKTSGVKSGRLVAGAQAEVGIPTVKMQIETSGLEAMQCLTSVPPLVEEWDDGMIPNQLVEAFEFVDVQVADNDDWDQDGLRDELHVAPDLPGDIDGALKIYFLKVTRSSSFLDSFNPCNAGMTSVLGYLTNLTYLVPRYVEMWAELDDDLGGEDNMRIHMAYDHGGYRPLPPAASSVYKVFDEPDKAQLHGYDRIRGYYVDSVWPTFWEMDEDEHLNAWAPYEPFAGVGPLGGWYESEGSVFQQFSDGGNPDSADYYYYFHFTVCHTETAAACHNPAVSP